tara:strand:- start:170 stop:274 length:105 start_codon:yes stop_codon:yes gene_type:complete
MSAGLKVGLNKSITGKGTNPASQPLTGYCIQNIF